ncbi:uncharacterized protein YggE [Endobacter medicaginis]|uniref:SIMPL domain-containing protein n=1 Tax=Endobacter medicaginis TaxID=1181271 RepID=A0A839UPU7_9PROT|nr:SIMPL domain-containing protein [Endobacter medicaginis]MBB3172218.1 uncharacterized protein YggE [Endobacter medicaginis]MCX5476578.1 SIMPL domain-containing protein [Endobacter medicaginis]NVN30090.1 SIMPL domain-containing protein [Endobacter medicaginis]
MTARTLLALSLIWAAPAMAQTSPPAHERSVSAEGGCTALVAPDRGRLTIWTQRTESSAGRASAEATAALATLRGRLDGLHLADAAIESNGVQIDKQPIDGPKGPTGFQYQARAGLQLDSSDIAGLGRAMDAVASADEIAPMAVYVSEGKRQQAIDACLPKATAEAKRHAEALLSGVGDRLGPTLRINGFEAHGGEAPASDLFGGGRPVLYARMAAPMAAKAEVSAGDRQIEVRSTVTFGILQ